MRPRGRRLFCTLGTTEQGIQLLGLGVAHGEPPESPEDDGRELPDPDEFVYPGDEC